MLLLNDGGYVTFRRLKPEAMQGIGEVDWLLIFVPSPHMGISIRFCYVLELEGGSISVISGCIGLRS
nr:hypothetical protein CFP56_22967 [Quercus suber]